MGRIFEKRKHKMFARYAKMSRAFTRIGKEIAIAVKMGGPDPDGNPRLRMILAKAKSVNMPKSNLDSAIKRAVNKEEGDFEEVLYEGKGPHSIGLMIETATNNPTRTVASFYDKAFAGHKILRIPVRVANSTHVFHQYTLQATGIDRTALRAFLAGKEIPSMVYYPIPLHLQKAYASSEYPEGSLPVTENLCKCVFSLPVSTEMDQEQLEYITRHVLEFCQ